MFERFTDKARTAVVLAQQRARERGDDAISTEHLLRALFAVPDDLAVMVLKGFSVSSADVEADLERRPSADAPDAAALAALGIDLGEVRRRAEEAFGPGRWTVRTDAALAGGARTSRSRRMPRRHWSWHCARRSR